MATRPDRGPLGDTWRAVAAAWQSPVARSAALPFVAIPLGVPLSLYAVEWDYPSNFLVKALVTILLNGGLALSALGVSRLLFPVASPKIVVATYAAAGFLHWVLARSGADPLLLHEPVAGGTALWRPLAAPTPLPLMAQWIIWLTLLTVTLMSVEEMRHLLWRTAQVERRLAVLQEESEERLRKLGRDWQALVQQVLAPKVLELRHKIAALDEQPVLTAVATDIQAFCRDQVRTASHELYSQPEPHPEPVGTASISDVLRLAFFRPGVNLLYAFPITVGFSFQFYLPRASLQVIALATFALVVAVVIGYFVTFATSWIKFDLLGLTIAYSVAFMSVMVWTTWRLLEWAQGLTDLSVAEVMAMDRIRDSFPIALLVCWIALCAVLAWRHGYELYTRRCEELTFALAQTRDASANQESIVRRRLALVLHGPVQGKLAAAALALTIDPAQQPEADPLVTAQRLLDEVLQELQTLDTSQQPVEAIAGRLSQIATDWEGILELGVQLDSAAENWLDQHPATATAVVQAVQEAAANALQHGNSRWLKARVSMDEAGVRAVLTSDSHPEPHQSPTGIGLQAISETGAQLEYSRRGDLFVLNILWPQPAASLYGAEALSD